MQWNEMQMLPQPFACRTLSISASHKAHWFGKEREETIFPVSGSVCEVTAGIFPAPCSWHKGQIQESSGEEANPTARRELTGCGFPPCVSDLWIPSLSTTNGFSLFYSLFFFFLYTCESLCNLTAIHILTSVCPLSRHQWLASYKSSPHNSSDTILSK